jgi:hypothetical protein
LQPASPPPYSCRAGAWCGAGAGVCVLGGLVHPLEDDGREDARFGRGAAVEVGPRRILGARLARRGARPGLPQGGRGGAGVRSGLSAGWTMATATAGDRARLAPDPGWRRAEGGAFRPGSGRARPGGDHQTGQDRVHASVES